jgi:hypothetical protein
MLVKNKKELWRVDCRSFIDARRMLVGITFTPWIREKK